MRQGTQLEPTPTRTLLEDIRGFLTTCGPTTEGDDLIERIDVRLGDTDQLCTDCRTAIVTRFSRTGRCMRCAVPKRMEDRDKKIVAFRNLSKPKSFAWIAKRFGITRQRVQQIWEANR